MKKIENITKPVSNVSSQAEVSRIFSILVRAMFSTSAKPDHALSAIMNLYVTLGIILDVGKDSLLQGTKSCWEHLESGLNESNKDLDGIKEFLRKFREMGGMS